MDRFYLQMHITNKCGNCCKHCYQDTYKGDDMLISQATAVLQELSSICKEVDIESHVAITGGDPLLHKEFIEIVYTARQLCDKVIILGNPENITPKIAKRLCMIGIDGYQLSLDGTRKTHDDNRYDGSFQNTIKAIELLKLNLIKPIINMTIMDGNRHQVEEVEEIALKHGAKVFGKDECVPHGEDCEGKEGCSLGYSAMAILPDMTLMACRKSPSSILGKWKHGQGLEYHFVNNPKMIDYRERR